MQADKIGRRRGALLETAILEAAWNEINDVGYTGMTLESVAKRAGTSRPVLSRRWPTRAKLATAAMGYYVSQNPISVPDTGNVHDDLCLVLRRMSDYARPDLIRLVFEMTSDLAETGSSFADLRSEITNDDLMRRILLRGVDRGEIDPTRLTPRIITLPTDLARHEILMTLKPLSEKFIQEIVEEIFLPLVR